jgi:hypothetical protein
MTGSSTKAQHLTRVVVPLLLTIFSFRATSQDRLKPPKTAKVTVSAVSVVGTPVSNTIVDAFVDEEGHDRLALFHRGSTATGVPFGKYRIAVHADDFRPSTFYVEIASSEVLITAGLEWYGVENIRVTAKPSGKLAGFPGSWGDWWCKASGLYSRLEYESTVNPDNLRFDFGEVPPGVYLLACQANRRFIVVRTIRIAADTSPFTIDYKSNQDGEPVKY